MTRHAADRDPATARRPRSAGSARAALVVALVGGAGVVTYALTRPKSAPPRPRPTSSVAATARLAELPELGPLAALRASGGGDAAFDRLALDHVLGAVASGSIPWRAAGAVPVETVAALEGAEAPGRLVDVEGVVRSLDRERFASPANARWDQLWAFALEGDRGGRVVVVHPGASTDPDDGRPVPVRGGEPIADGDRVRVRGVVVQRRTGGVGSMNLSTPTVVVAGQQYRRVRAGKPAPKTIADVPWSSVDDRELGNTLHKAVDVQWAAVAWQHAVGHKAIFEDLASGRLTSTPWHEGTFHRWKEELGSDSDHSKPDPRTSTNQWRGKVFVLTGELADAVEEDWQTVPVNDYGVDAHTTYWILSDHYRAAIPLFSAFPPSTFPDVRNTKTGEKPRVRAFAAFLRNYSFTPRSSAAEITVPSFVLLHVEPK
jgi:hypothetical protein